MKQKLLFQLNPKTNERTMIINDEELMTEGWGHSL